MRRLLNLSLMSFIAAAVASGCTSREVAQVEPRPDKVDGPRVPVEINRNIDILFVIDNSGSMQEEQIQLNENFPLFINVLKEIEGGLPNVHIGVVSTDVGAGPGINGCEGDGDNGELQFAPRVSGCTGPTDKYIMDVQDPGDPALRITNYDSGSTLEETFSCIASLGTGGCGFEQPLESMYRALLDPNNLNQGFLREDAFLAVIIISDEDDCSTEDNRMFADQNATLESELGPLNSFRCFEFGVACEPDNNIRSPGQRQECGPRVGSQFMYDIDRYAAFLKNELNKDPADIIVAGIIGDTGPVEVVVASDDTSTKAVLQPSCEVRDEENNLLLTEAAPAIRLKAFLDLFPQRNTFTTICNEQLDGALVLIANLLKEVIGNPCMKGNIDTDPNAEGIQEECVVSDVRFPDTVFQEETLLPRCTTNPPNTSEAPCWYLEDNPACTPPTFPSGKALVVERNGAEVPSGTVVIGSCVVQ